MSTRPSYCTISKKIMFINITIHLIKKTFNYESAVKFTAVDSDGHACWSQSIDSNAISQKCLGGPQLGPLTWPR